MPAKILKGFGDYLTVHWKKSKKFPYGSISVAHRKNLCDGSLRSKNLLNKEVLMNAEGINTICKVVCQGIVHV